MYVVYVRTRILTSVVQDVLFNLLNSQAFCPLFMFFNLFVLMEEEGTLAHTLAIPLLDC